MSQLADEQIEAAAKANYNAQCVYNGHGKIALRADAWSLLSSGAQGCYREGMRAAAPFLQMPWDYPTDAEWISIIDSPWVSMDGGRSAINHFIAVRNLALIPKPVDPRREKVLSIIGSTRVTDKYASVEQIADLILAALYAKD